MTPPALRETAARWRGDLEAVLQWELAEGRTANPGEAGGFFVDTDGFPHPAYLKPTRICQDTHPRAAIEKIASDFAYDLGLPLPPALLYRRPNCPADEEQRACVLLVLYEENYPWGEVWSIDGLALQIVRSTLTAACGIIAFDAWIGNKDRNNKNNVLFGSGADHSGWVFIDSANSLNYGGQWEEEKWRSVARSGRPVASACYANNPIGSNDPLRIDSVSLNPSHSSIIVA